MTRAGVISRIALTTTALFFTVWIDVHAQEPDDSNIYKMSVRACESYAHDGERVALMRDGGIAEEDVRRVFSALRGGWYDETTWQFFSSLITLTYAAEEDSETWAVMLFQQCMKTGGLRRMPSA